MTNVIIADPQDVTDYAFEFAALLETGETLAEYAIDSSTGVTVADGGGSAPGPVIAGSKVVIWVSGGTLNGTYDIACHVTTSAGREFDLTMTLWMLDR